MKKKIIVLLTLLLVVIAVLAGEASQRAMANTNEVPQTLSTAQGIDNIQQALETHVSQMISSGHLAPTLYFIGLGGEPIIFYTTPSETLYTLSAAYPYLSTSLQTQVKMFLDTELQYYPPQTQGYYPPHNGTVSDLVGARREYFIPNPEQSFNFRPGIDVHVSTLYALWLYSKNTGDWDYVTTQYTALKAIYTDFKNAHSISSYPELSGVIGFSRIAQHLGQTADYQDATNFAETGYTAGANFDQFFATAQARYPAGSHGYTIPIFMFNRNPVAVHFDRDIGDFLREHAASAVAAYVAQVDQDVPLWWLTGVALSHGENAYTTPEIAWANFMLHAYVLNTPQEQLASYLDAPDRKGDLLYIQKLVALLETASVNLSTSSKTVSSVVPRMGQTVTYTIFLRSTGIPITSTVFVTDTVPSGLAYQPGTFTATSGTANADNAPILRWSGVLSDTPTVVLRYAVTVTESEPRAISNLATIETEPVGLFTRQATIIANGKAVYLPVILK